MLDEDDGLTVVEWGRVNCTVLNVLKGCRMEKRVGNKNFEKSGNFG